MIILSLLENLADDYSKILYDMSSAESNTTHRDDVESKQKKLSEPNPAKALDHLTPTKNKDELTSFICKMQSNVEFILVYSSLKKYQNLESLLKRMSCSCGMRNRMYVTRGGL